MKGTYLLALFPLLLTVPAPAQGTFLFESPEHNFRLRVPRILKQAPLDPQEAQILARFSGNVTSSTDSFLKDEILDLTVAVFRIAKAKGPTTGSEKDKEEEAERMRSIGEMTKEQLNGATDLKGFLRRRSMPSDFVRTNVWTRPVKSKEGPEFAIHEWHNTYYNNKRGESRDYPLLRVFVLEDDKEIFGVYAWGVGLNAAADAIAAAMRTLERVTIDPNVRGAGEDDPYEGSELRDIERRRLVRSQLVKGWNAYDTENFILVTNSTSRKMIDDMLLDLEIMRKEYIKHFPPIEEVTAVSTVRVCASYDDYLGYGAPDGTGGYWHPIKEELVLFEPGRRIPKQRDWLKEVDPNMVLYHEAKHQYLHYSNGQVAPASWFNEGYGEYFGGARLDRTKGEIRRIEKNSFRMKWVKLMQKQNQGWPDLRNILEMPQHQFYGPSVLQNYAMGWSFCWFLEQERAKTRNRNEEWAAIPENYLKNLRAAADKVRARMPPDAPKDWMLGFEIQIQAEAYEKTFGHINLVTLERAWLEAMKRY